MGLARAGRVAAVAVTSAALASAAVLGIALRRAHTANALLAEARERLQAPFVQAPTIDRIQASTAISLLERARALGGEGAEVRGLLHYAEALEDLQRGDLILAEGELASALTYLGETVDLLVLAAALSRGRMLHEQARTEVERALAREPGHARARLLAADLALDAGDGAMARSHLEQIAAQVPDSGLVWNRLGLAHEQMGELARAHDAYRRATELDPSGQEPWINLGRVLRLAGRIEEAHAAFDTAVARAGTDPAAHLGRGLTRAALGRTEDAAADFRRAAELAPNDAEPLLALGDLLRDAGRVQQAVAIYREAIEREDADAASWLKLGNALALLERWDAAAAAFEQAIARSADLAAARNGLGACLMHLGRDEEARGQLERAAELDPTDPHPLMNLALLYERRGDRAGARQTWGRVLERAPGSATARARMERLRG